MRNFIIAGLMAAMAVQAAPSLAQNGPDPAFRDGRHDPRDDRGRDYRPDRGPDRGRDRGPDRGPDHGPDGGPRGPDRGPGRGQDFRRYDYNNPDPRYGNYQANRYYRGGNNYKARRLGANDRIYRGSDNRYYCRRNDGTTGLIVGGITGGVLGNVIAPGGSKTLATILGGGAGALLGRSVDRGNITCR